MPLGHGRREVFLGCQTAKRSISPLFGTRWRGQTEQELRELLASLGLTTRCDYAAAFSIFVFDKKARLPLLPPRRKKEFILYDGFEPSGRMHIAQGLFKAINATCCASLCWQLACCPCQSEVNKCTEAGGLFKFWIADWFGLMNDKMGGDLKKIQAGG